MKIKLKMWICVLSKAVFVFTLVVVQVFIHVECELRGIGPAAVAHVCIRPIKDSSRDLKVGGINYVEMWHEYGPKAIKQLNGFSPLCFFPKSAINFALIGFGCSFWVVLTKAG